MQAWTTVGQTLSIVIFFRLTLVTDGKQRQLVQVVVETRVLPSVLHQCSCYPASMINHSTHTMAPDFSI